MIDKDKTPFPQVYIPDSSRGKPTVYKPEFIALVKEAGAQGASIKGMWAYLIEQGHKVALSTFMQWVTPKAPSFIPEFNAAVREGQALAQAKFEKIGIQASNGEIPKHAASTYQFLVKNRFKQDYRDESFQNVQNSGTVKITPEMSPQIAAQKYKDLILNSGKEQSFEDFIDEID